MNPFNETPLANKQHPAKNVFVNRLSMEKFYENCYNYRYRLTTEYGYSIEFSELWDRLQNEGRCCGVTGPQVNKKFFLFG